MNQHQHSSPAVSPKNIPGAKPPFFQPRPDADLSADQYSQRTDMIPGNAPTKIEDYFFKPDRSAGNLIQRAPVPGSSTVPTGQPVVSQTQTRNPSVAHRQIPHGAIARAEFENYVTTNYGVADIHDGTQQEQELSLTRTNGPTPSIPNWQQWSPGASSEDYSFIIQAIEDVAASFMAIPNINKIIFYQMHYEPNPAGVGIANPDVGASFGAGELTIYQAFSGNRAFPSARSNAQGNYPPAGAVLSGPGRSPGAPRPLQSRGQSLKENIVHELGHGIAEAAHAADPQALTNFNTTVGWVGTNPSVLYDIGQTTVQTAITGGAAPPVQYKIESTNWNDPQWIEQPMSAYSVIGGPGEDFAESIAAYIYTPTVLQARSPRRFQFISGGIMSWRSQMRAMPPVIPQAPVGDFPVTDQMRHTA